MTPSLPPIAILAGGMATRLRSVSPDVPKAMIEVAGAPFIAHQLARLHKEGIRRAVFCLGHQAAQIEAFLGDGSRFGMQISYSYDGDTLLGTGGAIAKALPLLGETFYITYGDTLLDVSYSGVAATLARHPDALGVITVLRNDNRWDKSNMALAGERILAYDKTGAFPGMRHIDYGLSLFRAQAFESFRDRELFDLGEVFIKAIGAGAIIGYEVTQRFYEIGTPESLQETARYLTEKKETWKPT